MQIINNKLGKVRRVSLNGREYLVAPMTLIVPGVLAGSKGPLYYPPEEVGREPWIWNHMPIVVYHPVINGNNVSARSPEVAAKSKIGEVYNAFMDGKLRAEGWFDVEATKRVDKRVYDALVGNKPLELSTGLFTDNQPAPRLNQRYPSFNGREYHFIARNYRPDHLAILPDQKGACSLQDGCGVLINKADKPCCAACAKGKPCTGKAHTHDEEPEEEVTDNHRSSFMNWLGRTLGIISNTKSEPYTPPVRTTPPPLPIPQEEVRTTVRSQPMTCNEAMLYILNYSKDQPRSKDGRFARKGGGSTGRATTADTKDVSSLVEALNKTLQEGKSLQSNLQALSDKLVMMNMTYLHSQLAEIREKLALRMGPSEATVARTVADTAMASGSDAATGSRSSTKPTKAQPPLRPVEDRLKQIIGRERQKGTPFVDMVMYHLKQDRGSMNPVVPESVSYPDLFKDLQRQARGERPIYTAVGKKDLAQALRAVSTDFGKLKVKEFNKLLPHLNYPTHEVAGVTGMDSVKQRHVPEGVLGKVVFNAACYKRDDLPAYALEALKSNPVVAVGVILEMVESYANDRQALRCAIDWLVGQVGRVSTTANTHRNTYSTHLRTLLNTRV